MIAELVELYGIDVEMRLVKSEHTIADALTRVPKRWLGTKVCAAAGT